MKKLLTTLLTGVLLIQAFLFAALADGGEEQPDAEPGIDISVEHHRVNFTVDIGGEIRTAWCISGQMSPTANGTYRAEIVGLEDVDAAIRIDEEALAKLVFVYENVFPRLDMAESAELALQNALVLLTTGSKEPLEYYEKQGYLTDDIKLESDSRVVDDGSELLLKETESCFRSETYTVTGNAYIPITLHVPEGVTVYLEDGSVLPGTEVNSGTAFYLAADEALSNLRFGAAYNFKTLDEATVYHLLYRVGDEGRREELDPIEMQTWLMSYTTQNQTVELGFGLSTEKEDADEETHPPVYVPDPPVTPPQPTTPVEIEDELVPLDPMPVAPEEPGTTEIADSDVPLDDSPKTGQNRYLVPVLMFIAAISGVLPAIAYRKKKTD